jgi:hypothetical protein
LLGTSHFVVRLFCEMREDAQSEGWKGWSKSYVVFCPSKACAKD